MSKKIKCKELGFQGCDFIAEGMTSGDVVKEIVEHLKNEHDINMPDADVILKGRMSDNPFTPVDKATELVIERLTEKLNINMPDGSEPPTPLIR